MVWSGIPFPFVDILPKDNIVLQITKLPTLMVDNGFPWETLLGSLIAGSIPAFIAWKTIKNNNDLMHRQIILSSQQKNIDELKELCANYIAIRSNAIEFTDVIYNKYDGEQDKFPFDVIADLRNDYLKMHRCINLIYLIVGPSNPLCEKIDLIIEQMDAITNDYFDNYGAEGHPDSCEQDKLNDELLGLFSQLIEQEKIKVYS